MKKEQRAEFRRALAAVHESIRAADPKGPRVSTSLCGVCRFADWFHNEVDCRHPLLSSRRVNLDPFYVWEGEAGTSDCWLFRPTLPVEDVEGDIRDQEAWARERGEEDAEDDRDWERQQPLEAHP